MHQVHHVFESLYRYTPIIGKALNEATPTVYYTIAETADDAKLTYQGIVPGTATPLYFT